MHDLCRILPFNSLVSIRSNISINMCASYAHSPRSAVATATIFDRPFGGKEVIGKPRHWPSFPHISYINIHKTGASYARNHDRPDPAPLPVSGRGHRHLKCYDPAQRYACCLYRLSLSLRCCRGREHLWGHPDDLQRDGICSKRIYGGDRHDRSGHRLIQMLERLRQ